jgi:hypothetical protein
MVLVELGADRLELTGLEGREANAAPALGCTDQGCVHELEHGPLAVEEVRDDLRAPALLDEEALEQVGRADELAVRDALSTSGLLLSPTPSRRTPGTFPGAIQSLPPELPVNPLDPQVKIPDASFRPQRPRPARGSFV